MRQYLNIHLLLLLAAIALVCTIAKAQATNATEANRLLQTLPNARADTGRINLVLQLGLYYIDKPGDVKTDLDSALLFAKQAEGLSTRLKHAKGEGKSYVILSQVYRAMDNKATGKEYINKAVAIFSKYGYVQELGEAYGEQKNYFDAFNTEEELAERIKIVSQSLAAFKQCDNKLKQATTLQELADLHGISNDLPQCKEELKQALVLFQSLHYANLQGVYDLLCVVSTKMSDYQEGVKYGLLAVQTAENVGDSSTQLCTIYNRLGITYQYIHNHEQALIYYRKGLAIAMKLKDENAVFTLINNITNVLLQFNRVSEALTLLLNTTRQFSPPDIESQERVTTIFINIYLKLKQYNNAEPYFNKLLQLEKYHKSINHSYMTFYNTVIHYCIETKHYDLAHKYFLKYKAIVDKLGQLTESSTLQRLWFKLDSARGNYLSALNHYQSYKMLEDSFFNETKSKQIATLDVQYQTRQKEKDLKAKEQRIQNLNQQRKQELLIRNFIIGGSVLLLLLLVVIYNRYRLKQRSNGKLQVQQQVLESQQKEINEKNNYLSQLLTEKDLLLIQKDTLIDEKDHLLTEKEWLLKEIHHRVKNNLQVVMSLLNSQAASLQDKAALAAIQESQHRVQAMALIHQKLYQSDSVARIPMASYIQDVVAYLHESYNLPQLIRFNLLVDPLELDVTLAVPLGLIINEAITNAFKYAFPNGRPGTVNISLHRLEQSTYQLIIKDDGVGLSSGYDPAKSRSLGMTLMHGFSRQLGGELTINGSPGLTISLVFAEEQLSPIFTHAAHA